MKNNIITGLTMGEPSSISGEITLKVWKNYRKRISPFIYFGDKEHLEKVNKRLKNNVPIKLINNLDESFKIFQNFLPVYNIKLKENVVLGKPSLKNAVSVMDSIDLVIKLAIKKKLSNIVTNPIEKSIIKKKIGKFTGHTEYISNFLSISKSVMFLTSPKISVVPLTQHIGLKEAIKEITKKRIIWTTKITDKYLKKYFLIKKPKIAITGLNPHAGEKGDFGSEENKIIKPAIKKLKSAGINVKGPFPADTIFNKKLFDVVICMYHDQATIPIKTLDYENGVNVTLGLPIIRTSPDHGTALDIAGKNIASEKSLYSSILKAQEISLRKRNWIR